MDIILHHIPTFPPTGYNSGEVAKLDEYDAEALFKRGFVEAWYWYSTGSYEGSGQLIGRGSDGRWGHLDMGHCSCYGPADSSTPNWRDTLGELIGSMTDDLRGECSNVIAAIAEPQP